MSEHVEFPKLTPEAGAAHDAAINAIQSTTATISDNDLRRALAAFLQKAMEQADPMRPGFVPGLCLIADNLHSRPRQ